jgi:hypothetical protein
VLLRIIVWGELNNDEKEMLSSSAVPFAAATASRKLQSTSQTPSLVSAVLVTVKVAESAATEDKSIEKIIVKNVFKTKTYVRTGPLTRSQQAEIKAEVENKTESMGTS